MKKIISVLMISAMALSSIPLVSAPVVSNYSTTALAETGNLSSLASFLGADTAYFSFTNYTKKYLDTDMIITDCEDQSYGISMLQILSHNGIFTVSDIQSGAENLSDVQFNSGLESLIESYQLTRFNVPQLKLKRAFVENDIATLVQTAMTAMTAQKYFHISLSISGTFPDGTNYSKATHDVVGIGITDGSWTFNGISYNKCILTLDSNTASFDKNYCIYVNTADNTLCIPAYNDVALTAVIADDTVLNYQGKLGEQVQPPVDITDPVTPDYPSVDPENAAEISIFTQTSKKIDEYYDEDINEYIPVYEKTEEEFEVTAGDYTYDSFYLELHPNLKVPLSDSYVFSFKDSESDKHSVGFSIESKEGYSYVSSQYDAESAEVSAHKVSMKTSDKDSISAVLMPSETLYDCFYNYFNAKTFDSRNFVITDREDGILLHSNSSYIANMVFGQCDGDRSAMKSKIEFRIEPSSENLLLRYDEETQKIRAFIDSDDNDVYETEIQNGDINCNGRFDATDASGILKMYSELSTSENYPMKYVNIFADCNGDGVIDSSDAAEVLSKYAESSTS